MIHSSSQWHQDEKRDSGEKGKTEEQSVFFSSFFLKFLILLLFILISILSFLAFIEGYQESEGQMQKDWEMGESRVQNVSVLKKQQKWKKKKMHSLLGAAFLSSLTEDQNCHLFLLGSIYSCSGLCFRTLLHTFVGGTFLQLLHFFQFQMFLIFFFWVCVLLSEGSQGRQFQFLFIIPHSFWSQVYCQFYCCSFEVNLSSSP